MKTKLFKRLLYITLILFIFTFAIFSFVHYHALLDFYRSGSTFFMEPNNFNKLNRFISTNIFLVSFTLFLYFVFLIIYMYEFNSYVFPILNISLIFIDIHIYKKIIDLLRLKPPYELDMHFPFEEFNITTILLFICYLFFVIKKVIKKIKT